MRSGALNGLLRVHGFAGLRGHDMAVEVDQEHSYSVVDEEAVRELIPDRDSSMRGLHLGPSHQAYQSTMSAFLSSLDNQEKDPSSTQLPSRMRWGR